MSNAPTTTHQQRGWRIADPILRFRALETDDLYLLPTPSEGIEVFLGTSASSTLRLHDPTGRASRRHAFLAWDGARWTLRDLASKNGLWVDGVRRSSAELVPGLELGVGGLTLVAESADLLDLRALAARLLGWTDDRRHTVDRALRALRHAAQLHASLVLCGDGDLEPIARRLHRETLGPERPFVACERGDRALELLESAGDGTLCVSAIEPPRDILHALDQLRSTDARCRLVLCAPAPRDASPLAAHAGPTEWLELPPLAERALELPRILAEAADDAAAELGQPITSVGPDDIAQLAALPFDGLADLHDAALRLVALRTLGVSAGAARLGITHGALSRWARRRDFSA